MDNILSKQEELATRSKQIIVQWYNKNWEVGFPAHVENI